MDDDSFLITDEDFRKALRSAVDRGAGDSIWDAVGKYATFCGKSCSSEPAISDEIFEFLIQLLSEEAALKIHDIYGILTLFQAEWSRLSVGQQERLFQFLTKIYDKGDWMIQFETCEILGKNYADSKALEALRQFGRMESEDFRVFVPHGLEHLIKSTQDPAVKVQAGELLKSFLQDPSQRVRVEAEAAVVVLSRADQKNENE